MTRKTKTAQPDVAERIYKALFEGRKNRKLALTIGIWPDPKPQILAAIQKELER